MSKITNIKIGRKTYKLKFGYGVNRKLADVYGLASYSALGTLISSLNFGGNDLTFEQTDFIGNLVFCAVSYHDGQDPDLDPGEFVDAMLGDTDQLTKVIEAYQAGFPKFDKSLGKTKAAPQKTRSRTRK